MTAEAWAIVAVVLALAGLVVLSRDPILRWLGVTPAREVPVRSAHQELRGTFEDLHRDGQVVKQDRDRMGGLLDLHELEVSDVMVHRMNMRSINADEPAESIVRAMIQSPHTRMPLWRGSLDNIVGVLHAKDVLRALDDVGFDFGKIDVLEDRVEAVVRA